MPNITLALPDDVYKSMKEHKEIRWSKIARHAIVEHVKKLRILDRIAAKSNLQIKEIERLNEKVKKCAL